MKIINLHAENFKRISAVDITPDSEMVILAGANEQGKSSILDAIMAALCGGRGMRDIPEPIKRGEERAEVELDLGDIKVHRIWERGGKNRIEVKNADGAKFSSPQAILDALTGALTFDPLEFSRMAPRDQRATLLRLIELPFDIDENDRERAALVSSAGAAAQEVRRNEARVNSLAAVPADTPDEEKPAADILKEIQARREVKAANDDKRAKLANMRGEYAEAKTAAALAAAEVERLEKALVDARQTAERLKVEQDEHKQAGERLATEVAVLVDPDMSELDGQLERLDEVNRNVRQKKAHAVARQELSAAKAAEKKCKNALAAHDNKRAEALASAKFPVDGLGFTDDGVTLGGLPFAQASESQRIMTSAAMGMAMNPRLRVMFIRDGSALDGRRKTALAEMAKEHDFQLWVECVDETGAIGIVIEDGHVAGEKCQQSSAATN